MIPRTYPSTLNPATGQRQLVALFLNDVTGLQRWSDYIPVNFGKGTTLIEGSYDNNGYIAVQEITSGIGLIPFGDYVPVFFDPAATDTWQVSSNGFIPYGVSGVTSVPSLDIVFTRSDVLDPRITFTRASTATRTNASGLIESVAINGARFDYDPVTRAPKGLLIEEQRTNLLTYSEQFDNVLWVKINSTIAANTTTAPDGTLTSDTLIANTSTAEHYADNPFSVISGNAYTFTCYVKAAGLTNIGLRFTVGTLWTGSVSPQTRFNLIDLTTLAVGGSPASASITNVGNNWYRVQMSVVAISTGTASARLHLMSGASNTFAGDGTSGIYIWGAQLEAGASATSYIPTVASQVTRAADVAVMTGTNFSSWYNQSEGTLYAEAVLNNAATTGGQIRRIADINDASTNNRISFGRAAATAAALRVQYIVAGVPLNGTNGQTAVNVFPFVKVAVAYKATDYAFSANGIPATTSTAANVPIVTQLTIGSDALNSSLSMANGHIKQISYYPRRLANEELQGLTA